MDWLKFYLKKEKEVRGVENYPLFNKGSVLETKDEFEENLRDFIAKLEELLESYLRLKHYDF